MIISIYIVLRLDLWVNHGVGQLMPKACLILSQTIDVLEVAYEFDSLGITFTS